MNLPDFPWDRLHPFQATADQHPDGRIELSIGTPVDATPEVVQQALRSAANAPGYPTTAGTVELRTACADWLNRRLGVAVDIDAILPVIGSKEFIAQLPILLGLGAADTVSVPSIAYPTYAVGAQMAGCRVAQDDASAAVRWLNSPSNPTGHVLTADQLRDVISPARTNIVISDECYIELGWSDQPVSVLHPSVVGADHRGILALHSLSKRSNMAGYRFGFLTGDPELIARLLEIRKHLGAMVPLPVQQAAIAAWSDDVHVEQQRERYLRRRQVLREALIAAGFHDDGGAAGLYLWMTRGESCWHTLGWFAERGIVVAPGAFYGSAGDAHVRIALTATDADITRAARRIAEAS